MTEKVSVVVPMFNDAGIIAGCYRELRACMDRLKGRYFSSYELVFVDDGSRDGTSERLREVCSGDRNTIVVELDRNYGQHAAISAGFETAGGDVIVTLDSDLQISPEEIPKLLDRINEGYDLVSGIRVGRADSFFSRTLPSRLFNILANRVTGVRLRDWGCPTVTLTRSLAKKLLAYGEMRRFLKPLGAVLSRSIGEVELEHRPRIGGRSRYTFQDLFHLALDFIINFSRRPFQKVSLFGTSLFFLGVLGGILYLLLRFCMSVQLGNRSQALIFLLTVVGLQLMILGFLGEFIIRIYRIQNRTPFYTIGKIHLWKEE